MSTTIQRFHYKGWPDAYRLFNGEAEVVVVPAVARVLRFARLGGPNLVWENPATLGQPAKAGEWPNFGGDKAWPWPQDDWPKRLSGDWPPPTGADDVPHAAEVTGRDTVRLTSPVVAGYGVRIVRDITLHGTGAKVTTRTRLEKVEGAEDILTSAWTILQTVVPTSPLVARLVGKSSLPEGWKKLDKADWKRIERRGEHLVIERDPDRTGKIGFDGDALAAVFGDTLLTVRATPDAGDFRPGERGQVYNDDESEDDRKQGIPAYVEWEFTAPLKPLKKGEASVLTVEWELAVLPEDRRTIEAATAALEKK